MIGTVYVRVEVLDKVCPKVGNQPDFFVCRDNLHTNIHRYVQDDYRLHNAVSTDMIHTYL